MLRVLRLKERTQIVRHWEDSSFAVLRGASVEANFARVEIDLSPLQRQDLACDAPARQRLVLSHNYQPFLGNLKPIDIADRLQRTLDYVVPYEKRILASMNTGHPYILRANRWQRLRRAIDQVVADLDGVPAAVAAVEPNAVAVSEESRVRLGAERRKGLSL